MKYLLILFLLFSLPLQAQEVNEKYSYKDFLNQSFKKEKAEDFNNSIIIGSTFYQEWVEGDIKKDIFPEGMTGVIFKKCNLDNVEVPVGNTVDKSSVNKKIKVQNDLEDWILDKDDNPVEPIRKEKFVEYNLSIDPADIPLTKKEISIIKEKKNEIANINNN